ncbi:flagellar biosynthesis regulator FlaF [Roseovarius sp. 2305UL8-3]|uniref:flagellar biosynthesis regulator FlaF n=1 Tax=Roseovarius conchicola TaxID=3121636 RepID=UPI0035287D80
MNAIRQAQNAYGQGAQPIRTHRGAEYDAFAQITSRLKSSAAKGKSGFADLARAIHDNRRLWTALAADVGSDGNALPKELRARIVYLAEFTRLRSGQALTQGASVEPLIDINAAMMRGLRDERAKP